jgi:hypothetical protein
VRVGGNCIVVLHVRLGVFVLRLHTVGIVANTAGLIPDSILPIPGRSFASAPKTWSPISGGKYNMDPLFLVTTTMIRRAITPANSTTWIYVGLSGSHWVHPVLQRFAMKLDQTFSETNAPDLNLNSIGVVMRGA